MIRFEAEYWFWPIESHWGRFKHRWLLDGRAVQVRCDDTWRAYDAWLRILGLGVRLTVQWRIR